jgi:amidase
MTDIAFAPATRLASLTRRKKISCLELLEHYLARFEKYDPTVNAIVVTDIAGARKRARAADRALAKGQPWGPFHGVPMTIKESFNIAGLPTTWGIPGQEKTPAKRNAAAVERWLAAGAVIFGKTNVPIHLADGQSFNAVYGATRNPWDLTRTPGGSSGGSAAALAAGLTGIETGSDIASSIRNPAHNCGVYGHKPTYGLCPLRGHALGEALSGADISVIGPLARSATDLAPALAALAGPDEIEASGMHFSLPPPRRTKLKFQDRRDPQRSGVGGRPRRTACAATAHRFPGQAEGQSQYQGTPGTRHGACAAAFCAHAGRRHQLSAAAGEIRREPGRRAAARSRR